MAIALLSVGPAASSTPDDRERLERMRSEISRLEDELSSLEGREQGILGELERMDAELELRETEHEEVALRLEGVTASIERHDRVLAELEQSQSRRRDYLAFRLREIYKAGPDPTLRRLLAGDALDGYWKGLGYAAYLSERDSEVLRAYRSDAVRLQRERSELQRASDELVGLRDEARNAHDALSRTRRQRASLLRRVREDQSVRRTALDELQTAAEELSRVIETVQPGEVASLLDPTKFKGLMDWPAQGSLGSGFGTVIHPRFKTEVPHPGWDIEAEFGSDVIAIFDGRVVFADWMRGYGLTVIVDHGAGLLSIYAHASVLMAQPGERVRRGQVLGKVGDTGSLRGSFLYFELRLDGKPIDPKAWLRPR